MQPFGHTEHRENFSNSLPPMYTLKTTITNPKLPFKCFKKKKTKIKERNSFHRNGYNVEKNVGASEES